MSAAPLTYPDTGSITRRPETGPGEHPDQRGRFAPDNRCGPHQSAVPPTAAYRQALRAAISPGDITEIAEVLRELALDGNLSAIRLLLSYVVGRPGAADEPEATPEPPPQAAPVMEPAPAPDPGQPSLAIPAGDSSAGNQMPARPGPKTEQSRQPPSATVAIGGVAPQPPSATAPPTERPPRCAIRRWPHPSG